MVLRLETSDKADSLFALYMEKDQAGLNYLPCRKIPGLCVAFLLSCVDELVHRLSIST